MRLSLHIRLVIATCGAIILCLGLLYGVVSWIFLESFEAHERRDTRGQALRARELLQNRVTALENDIGDWSKWDATYQFMLDHNQTYIDENLVQESIDDMGLNAILYVDRQGSLYHSYVLDPERKEEVEAHPALLSAVAPGSPLVLDVQADARASGVWLMPHGPMLLASRPVLTSEGSGPPRGTLVFARYLDQELVDGWSKTLRLPIEVFRADAADLPADVIQQALPLAGEETRVAVLGPDLVAGYAALRSADGQPAVLLRVKMPRTIWAQGIEARQLLLLALSFVGALLGAVVTVLLGRLIRAESERRRADELYEVFAEQTSDGILIADADSGRLLQVNPAARRMLRMAPGGPPEGSLREMLDGVHEVVSASLEAVFAGRGIQGWQIGLRRPGTESLHVELSASLLRQGTNGYVYVVARDMTERRQAEERVRYLAFHDALTGLPNRLLFQEELGRALTVARKDDSAVAVLFIDLDHFKEVNETLGHDAGDEVLQMMADRIGRVLRRSDIVARQGGDEFLVLLPGISHPDETIAIAQRLLDAVQQPWTLEGRTMFVSASIGLTASPDDGLDVATLVRNADLAMYRAKERGRGAVELFDPTLNDRIAEAVRLKGQLIQALKNEEFTVHYQPEVCSRTGRIRTLEALVRWESPELGMVFPGSFIPLAEESGLIVPIGEQVLRMACRQIQEWEKAGIKTPQVAVNLSPRQLIHEGIVDTIRNILREFSVDPSLLQLEVTESLAMEDPEKTRQILEELRALGCTVALDDFGTGYSALAYLRRFPFNRVKLDRSFIKDIASSPGDQAVVRGIIELAERLDLEVVAEGVETVAQFELLIRFGCTLLQGYGLSRPVPAREMETLLRQGTALFDRLAAEVPPLRRIA